MLDLLIWSLSRQLSAELAVVLRRAPTNRWLSPLRPPTPQPQEGTVFDRWTEIAGLLAALCWAVAGLVFSRIPASAGALNLGKNICGTAILLAVIFTRPGGGSALADLGIEPLLWLTASAIVGLVIGDRSYFRSLQILGPRRAMILSTLTPVFAAAVGWFLLAEVLDGVELLAIGVTLAGVMVVIRERSPAPKVLAGEGESRPIEGLLHGVNGALCQAVGTALAKLGMEGVTPLEASLVRLSIAAVIGLGIAFLIGRARPWARQLTAPGIPARILFASSIGTFLGIWMSLIAIGALPVAIANTQTATTPIFITVLVALLLRERVSPRAWIGTAVAMGGVALLLLA